MTQHEELEVGQEMDRALRAGVTGLAQLMERAARRQADRDRSSAADLRQEWLANRDTARRGFMPWTRPRTVEEAEPYDAARAWAIAASWSDMDPLARTAEQQLARRIQETHGEHPSILINKTDLSRLPEQPPAQRLLTMGEAVDLAREHAPFYYRDHDGMTPAADVPTNPAEERFHTDWQHYAEHGELPERTRWEAWAAHVGRAEEFATDQWRTPDGSVDHESRDSALVRVWDDGREERGIRDLEEHQVAMAAAGMPDLASQVNAPSRPTWVGLMEEDAFAAATTEEIAKAWRDARASGATGDLAAQAAAAQIAERVRAKHGLDPETYLLDAMTDRAAQHAEQRRGAEDRARRSAEAHQAANPDDTIGVRVAERPDGTKTLIGERTSETDSISRERVVELNHQAQDYFAGQFRPGTEGHRYVVDRLGEDAIEGPWALGYARPGWTNLRDHLRTQGATDEEILGAGLGRMSSRGNVIDAFRDRVTVGIRNADGEIVGFAGRDLSGDERAPKWINTGSTPAFRKSAEVFGLTEAPEGARLVRTEAAFDAMATTLAGRDAGSDGTAPVWGVAPLGTAMSDQQAQMIAERSDGRVWLANDGDKGGRQATEHDFYALARHGVDARHVLIPGGGDPAEAWRERPELLRSEISSLDSAPSAGDTVLDNYLESNRETLTTGSSTSTSGLDNVAAEIAGSMQQPLDRQLLQDRVARIRAELHGQAYDMHTDVAELNAAGADLDAAAAAARDPEQAERLASDADHVQARAGVVDHAGDRLEGSAGEHRFEIGDPHLPLAAENDAQETARPYDRASESNLDGLDPPSRDARVNSGHGFSQSTADSVNGATRGHRGVQAKRNRGTAGATQRRGRRLGK